MDFVFTAYMLGLKDILNECFRSQRIGFAEAIDQVSKEFPKSIYSNPIVTAKIKRLNVPLEDMHNFILPMM